jgi:hypothetical protein
MFALPIIAHAAHLIPEIDRVEETSRGLQRGEVIENMRKRVLNYTSSISAIDNCDLNFVSAVDEQEFL